MTLASNSGFLSLLVMFVLLQILTYTYTDTMYMYFPQYKRNHITSLYEACKTLKTVLFFFNGRWTLYQLGHQGSPKYRQTSLNTNCTVRCLPKKNQVIQFIIRVIPGD